MGLSLMLNQAYLNLRSRFSDEKGAVDIVAIVVLIAIVVAVALLFKDEIADLIDSIFENASTASSDLTTKATSSK